MEHSGPIVQYRTMTELLMEDDVGHVGQALDRLHSDPSVKTWLSRLTPRFTLRALHGSYPNAFENIMGKLVQLGLRAGLQPFDSKTIPFRAWLTDNLHVEIDHPLDHFLRTVVTSFLSYAGYGETRSVKTGILERLGLMDTTAKDMDFSTVYVEPSSDLVNPALYKDGRFCFPWIHDIIGLSKSKSLMEDSESRAKIERVVGMILRPEYQKLRRGYGSMQYAGRTYKIGWSVHLPVYQTHVDDRDMGFLLLAMELMAPFRVARESKWFKQSLKLLDTYRTDTMTYRFPRSWLPEKNSGYWVNGAYMALESNRRRPDVIECESTFRVLKIMQLMSF